MDGMNTNYRNHLYSDRDPLSKEYQLTKCINILGLIARCKDRLSYIVDNDRKAIYNNMIIRLSNYYNSSVLNIDKF